MDLYDWINTGKKFGRQFDIAKMARDLKTNRGQLNKIALGKSVPTVELADKIQKYTENRVTVEEIFAHCLNVGRMRLNSDPSFEHCVNVIRLENCDP